MSRFMSKAYARLDAYTPGEQPQNLSSFVKLNTNESPFPPSPMALACLTEAAGRQLRLYSDPTGRALRERLAKTYGVAMENVTLGNGSDDLLNFAFMAYGDAGMAYADISYGFNAVFADKLGVKSEIVPLKADLTIDPADYCGLGMSILIDNPNAPTGEALSRKAVERVIAGNPDNMVIVDEAYVDFGAESCVPLTKKYDNLLVIQTFSKSRALAGARLGFAIGCKDVIADMELLRNSTNPYNINRLTLSIGEAALCDPAYLEQCTQTIMENRAYTAEALKGMGFSMTNSLANFLFVKHSEIGGLELYQKLKEKGVLVRHFEKERIREYNRITIGNRQQMDVLLGRITEIINERRACACGREA
ncbi:MAG: histidinol-phosphate transaminase [Clostridia bacterium]|nr:histidinol-phosphate transaminase [Clostridia bacterium]